MVRITIRYRSTSLGRAVLGVPNDVGTVTHQACFRLLLFVERSKRPVTVAKLENCSSATRLKCYLKSERLSIPIQSLTRIFLLRPFLCEEVCWQRGSVRLAERCSMVKAGGVPI